MSTNQLFGILTILISSIGYYYSFKLNKQKEYTKSLFLLVLSGLLLRVFLSADFFLHEWDERYHALVAKNLITHFLKPTLYENPVLGFDYKDWTNNHVWVHKQPLPLWGISISLYLFGIYEWAVRIPSIIFTTLGIILMYRTAIFFKDKKVAFIAAFLYSINGLIIELSAGRVATDHPDIFFLFFIQLAVYFSVCFVQGKRLLNAILIGISIGAAILSKWLPALIVLPIWCVLILDSGKLTFKEVLKYGFVIVISLLIVSLPWQWYIYNYYPKEAAWEAHFNRLHITEGLDGHGQPFYYFLNKIRINYGELIYIPFFWYLFMAYKKGFKTLKPIALLIWFIIPFCFFSYAETKMQGYLLFTCPTLFIMTADFYVWLRETPFSNMQKWIKKGLVFLLIAFQKLKSINNYNIEKGVLFNCPKPIEAMFYTSLTAYNNIPAKKELEALMDEKYTVLIYKGQTIIPDSILEIKGLKWLESL